MVMSQLPKYFILWGLIAGLFLGFNYATFAQEEELLSKLYTEQRLIEIEKLLEQNRITNPDWKRFFDLLFVENADSVIQMLTSLYKDTDSRYLRPIIRHKLSQFYYARGYYETAQKVLSDDLFFLKLVSLQKDEKGYGIQLGAYSTNENARQERRKYLRKFKNLTIMTKNINGRKLYVLVVGKYSSKTEAQKALRTFRKKYGIKGYIIQY